MESTCPVLRTGVTSPEKDQTKEVLESPADKTTEKEVVARRPSSSDDASNSKQASDNLSATICVCRKKRESLKCVGNYLCFVEWDCVC